MDDIFQEVCINIWNGIEKFRGDSKWSTYIYRISVNTALGFARKRIKDQKIYIDHMPDNEIANLAESEESVSYGEEVIKRLNVLLNQLSIIDKAIITLFMEGQKTKEIAEVVGLTEPNVRVKLHRIRESLTKVMNPKTQNHE